MKKRLFSIWMAFVLLCTLFAGTGTLTATAEELPTFSVDEAWHATWTEDTVADYALLTVEQTGFYYFTLESDLANNTTTVLTVYDVTNDRPAGYLMGTLKGKKTGAVYLFADREYEIAATVIDASKNTIVAGNLTATLKERGVTPVDITVDQGARLDDLSFVERWVRFTPPADGDYGFAMHNQRSWNVIAYDAETGEMVDFRRVQYPRPVYGTYPGENVVLTLKKDVTYYIGFADRAGYFVQTTLNVSKKSKTVDTIRLRRQAQKISSTENLSEVNEALFDYTVFYTDGSQKVYSFMDLASEGYVTPKVMYIGDMFSLNGSVYWGGGYQPVLVSYKDEVYRAEVFLDPYCDRGLPCAPEELAEIVYANDHTDGRHPIAVQTTGVYSLVSDNPAAFTEASYGFVDDTNSYVYYSEQQGGFPLVKGRKYMLLYEVSTKADAYVGLQCSSKMIFPDTGANTWYSDAVAYVAGAGIMTGYQNGKFGTSDGIQRQDFLVMLASLDGVDLSAYEDMHGLFPDVAAGSYYEAAVAWGYENGIASGYQNGKFGVGDKITREQLVTMLYRYAQYVLVDVRTEEDTAARLAATYTDYGAVSDYAKEPVAWAVENGVISGKSPTKIAPHGNAQRCEVAQMMYKIFLNNVF